jgi:transcriptional regulator with XRE-family HTH domain
MSFSERIKEIIKLKNMKQNTFAQKTGIKRTTISGIINAGSVPGGEVLAAIIEAFPDISPSWLMTGKGQMLLDPSPATIHNSVVGHGNLVVKDGINTVASSDGRSDCAEIKKQLQEAREEIIRLKGQVELLKELLSKKH